MSLQILDTLWRSKELRSFVVNSKRVNCIIVQSFYSCIKLYKKSPENAFRSCRYLCIIINKKIQQMICEYLITYAACVLFFKSINWLFKANCSEVSQIFNCFQKLRLMRNRKPTIKIRFQ